MDKSPDAFRTISEVADWLGTPTHVLRFWESRFTQVKPVKRAGGRRYYRPKDMALLGGIKKLLHDDGMTIRGVQKMLREKGIGHVEQYSRSLDDGADQPVAPIEIDAKPEAVENVVPLKMRRVEPERGPRGDILQPPTAAELGQETPDNRKTAKAAKPAKESEPAKPTATVNVDADTSHPEIAREPLVADEPDEAPAQAMPGITGVAAALRAAANSSSKQKPEPEVFAEVYARLKTLRSNMDRNGEHKSAD